MWTRKPVLGVILLAVLLPGCDLGREKVRDYLGLSLPRSAQGVHFLKLAAAPPEVARNCVLVKFTVPIRDFDVFVKDNPAVPQRLDLVGRIPPQMAFGNDRNLVPGWWDLTESRSTPIGGVSNPSDSQWTFTVVEIADTDTTAAVYLMAVEK